MIKKYILYLLRWQLSTPILTLVLWALSGCNTLVATIVANLIGGLIFFWVDRWIFKKGDKKKESVETNFFDSEEIHTNCTVQILSNSVTGEVSVGWWENEDDNED